MAVKVTELPLHEGFVPEVSAIATAGVTFELIVILDPLLEPVTLGVLLTTLILYPAPAGVAPGIVAEIVPLDVELIVPMLVGLAKLPLELLN